MAAAAVLAAGILIAACGEEIVRIAQQFNVGKHATFVGYDDTKGTRSNVKETQSLELDDGVIMVTSRPTIFNYEAEIEREKSTATYGGAVTYFDTIDDVKPYLAFNPLMPVSLPTGFALDRISLFHEENGEPLPLGSGMYLNVYYINANKTQQIYMQVRMMNEETGFTASGGPDMRYITINGHKGVVAVKSVHVEIDGVMYMILADFSGDSVTQNDVIKMAESL
jgi:hypothetical protein